VDAGAFSAAVGCRGAGPGRCDDGGIGGTLAGNEDIERFTLEAKAVARLAHPQIVVIHDVGQCDDLRWLVIETGDPQCSGLGHIAPGPVAAALAKL
jgi:hypothetical protein